LRAAKREDSAAGTTTAVARDSGNTNMVVDVGWLPVEVVDDAAVGRCPTTQPPPIRALSYPATCHTASPRLPRTINP